MTDSGLVCRCAVPTYNMRTSALRHTVKPSSDGRAEALAHSTRRVHISLRDPSPPRPRTSTHDHPPPLNLPVWGQVGLQVPAGGGHAGADSTVKMITNEAELPCPQGHDHPLGCRHNDKTHSYLLKKECTLGEFSVLVLT